MKTLYGLLKDMITKADSLGYEIKVTGLWFEFYKNGIRHTRVRKPYNDCTISEAEYDRQMTRIK